MSTVYPQPDVYVIPTGSGREYYDRSSRKKTRACTCRNKVLISVAVVSVLVVIAAVLLAVVLVMVLKGTGTSNACSNSNLRQCTRDSDKKCIYASWFCDGETDCESGEDEENCDSCTTAQFACLDYKSCVPLSNRCNGVTNCADGSDERDCIQLKTLSNVDVLFGNYQGSYFPVCSTNWNSAWNNKTCSQMGYGFTGHDSTVSAGAVAASAYMLPQSGGTYTTSLLNVLIYGSSCTSGNTVVLSCSFDECGTRARRFALPSAPISAKVTNGFKAVAGNWPWQILLYYYGEFHCGGSLIDRYWVLTAAHCVSGYTPSPFTVKFGSLYSSSSDSNSNTIAVSELHVHPNYNSVIIDNDVALIKLAVSVNYTDFIRPVCLAQTKQNFSSFIDCYVTGFGAIDDQASDYPDQLREAKMAIISDVTCLQDSLIGSIGLVTQHMLCAGYSDGYLTVCNGDSGGPLVCSNSDDVWTQVGVVSWGPVTNTKECTGISVFAEVAAYRTWIGTYVTLT